MTLETETDDTSVFVRRGTRAALSWLTTGMITVNVFLIWYLIQKISNLDTRVSVIEDTRFTPGDAEKMRQDIESVRSGYIEAIAVIGGKIDLVQYRINDLRDHVDQISRKLDKE